MHGSYMCLCLMVIAIVNQIVAHQIDIGCNTDTSHCNNGSCVSESGFGRCNCSDGFFGHHCQHSFLESRCNEEGQFLCENNGTCTTISESVNVCMCPAGFRGRLCRQKLLCKKNSQRPCKNNGNCTTNSDGVHECMCSAGFIGTLCQYELRCSEEGQLPCQNNGNCTSIYDSVHECICPAGFKGPLCQHDQSAHSATQVITEGGNIDGGVTTVQTLSSTKPTSGTTLSAGPTPGLTDILPSYGPASGGTLVNITGTRLNFIHTIILGDNVTLEIDNITSTTITAVTPSYNVTDEPVPLIVTIGWNNKGQDMTQLRFTYRPDPKILDIYPRKTIKSGGTTVTVTGSNLDAVATPMITVTVSKRKSPGDKKTFYSPCTAKGSKKLTCVTPKIPNNIFGARKRRDTKKRDRRQTNNAGEDLDFLLGFQLDGVDEYDDLTKTLPHLAHMEVHPDPSFTSDQLFSFDPDSARVIGIKGENIDSGTVVEDYDVRIGQGSCTEIGITTDTLYCNPPKTLNKIGDSDNPERGQNEADITILVGSTIEHVVGYIIYEVEETVSLYTIFVPVVAALGVVLLITAIVLIVCACKQKGAKSESRENISAPSVADLTTLSPSSNDNYYTGETQPKNAYYMVVNPETNVPNYNG